MAGLSKSLKGPLAKLGEGLEIGWIRRSMPPTAKSSDPRGTKLPLLSSCETWDSTADNEYDLPSVNYTDPKS